VADADRLMPPTFGMADGVLRGTPHGWPMPISITSAIPGFVVLWPLGFAIPAYVTRSRTMLCCGFGLAPHHDESSSRPTDAQWREQRMSGNRAFNEYRAGTLRRLDEEQRQFREFLERLRTAKDKAGFDQFMADRRVRPQSEGSPS
jgi:uncharacterized protein DUF2852